MSHQLSNAEVRLWMLQKRQQHAEEDAADRANGLQPSVRPANFMKILNTTELHLGRSVYPYEKNPSVYSTEGHYVNAIKNFNKQLAARLARPFLVKYKKERKNGRYTSKGAFLAFKKAMVPKEITRTELINIENLAPKNVEMLQPLLESHEERFTADELQIIVDTIEAVFRPDEKNAKEQAKKSAGGNSGNGNREGSSVDIADQTKGHGTEDITGVEGRHDTGT